MGHSLVSQMPSKVRFFLWNMMWECFPARAFLATSDINLSPSCSQRLSKGPRNWSVLPTSQNFYDKDLKTWLKKTFPTIPFLGPPVWFVGECGLSVTSGLSKIWTMPLTITGSNPCGSQNNSMSPNSSLFWKTHTWTTTKLILKFSLGTLSPLFLQV